MLHDKRQAFVTVLVVSPRAGDNSVPGRKSYQFVAESILMAELSVFIESAGT
jgi:hypothetical protein